MFALACLHFQENECDFTVFEAGIGGRYDPVRLLGALCTCVTSVDYEHVELLGPDDELHRGKAALRLAFELGKGSYATIMVKRITAAAGES